MATKRYRQIAVQRAELEARKKTVAQEAHALADQAEADGRTLTDGERQRREAILADLEGLKGQIDVLNTDLEAEAKLEDLERVSITTANGPRTDPSIRVGPNQSNDFRSLGEFLQAVVISAGTPFGSRMPNADVLMNKMAQYQAAVSGMSVGVPSDGGYLVRTDWSSALLNKAQEEAVLLPRTMQVPIGGDFDSLEAPYIDETSRATGSRWGGVQVFRKAEAGTVTAKQPKIGKIELKLEEIMGLAYATERLLRDAAALESILSRGFASEFAFTIDNEIFRGTGVGQCTGFFNHPAMVTVAAEAAQVADTVVPANVTKMYARMPTPLKGGAVWLIHPDVMTQLPLMVIGQQPVWLPPTNLVGAPNGMLFGKPVVEIEQSEAIGDVGDIMLVNLGEYVTITKAGEGLRQDSSMHVRFLFDEMAFRWVYRINGQPTWKTSKTPFKGTNNLSPFVALAAR